MHNVTVGVGGNLEVVQSASGQQSNAGNPNVAGQQHQKDLKLSPLKCGDMCLYDMSSGQQMFVGLNEYRLPIIGGDIYLYDKQNQNQQLMTESGLRIVDRSFDGEQYYHVHGIDDRTVSEENNEMPQTFVYKDFKGVKTLVPHFFDRSIAVENPFSGDATSPFSRKDLFCLCDSGGHFAQFNEHTPRVYTLVDGVVCPIENALPRIPAVQSSVIYGAALAAISQEGGRNRQYEEDQRRRRGNNRQNEASTYQQQQQVTQTEQAQPLLLTQAYRPYNSQSIAPILKNI